MASIIGISYALSTGVPYPAKRSMGDMERRTPLDRAIEALRESGYTGTQKEIAALLGIKQPSVAEWKNGGPKLQNAIVLARKLNVCVEWLLTERGPKRPGAPMDPVSQALWDAWGRISHEDRNRVVGFAQALTRPIRPARAPRSGVAG